MNFFDKMVKKDKENKNDRIQMGIVAEELKKKLPEQEMGIKHRIAVDNADKMMKSNPKKAVKYLGSQLKKVRGGK